MKYILILCAALSGVTLFLLASASANTTLFSQHYSLLLALNAAIALGLLVLVIFQLRVLWRKFRAKVFGSRLTLRLLLIFAFMALLPGLLVYLVSVQFLSKSIESWFDVRVDNALESGLSFARSALDNSLAELNNKAHFMASELSDQPVALYAASLSRLRERTNLKEATLLTTNGKVITSASKEISKLFPDIPSASLLRQMKQNRGYAAIEVGKDKELQMRVLVFVTPSSLIEDEHILQVLQPIPATLAQNAESVQTVYRDYQELSLSRTGLKRIYALTLTLTLLLALFLAIALAFFLSNRLSAPLSVLAEGTKAVAQGDFSPLQARMSWDELGVLTLSFNSMTRQLEEARALAEQNRIQIADAHAYLESILANVSAGVLAFDANFHLRAANDSACVILRHDFSTLQGEEIKKWSRLGEFVDTIIQGFAEHQNEDWQQEFRISLNGSEQILLVRGSRLPAISGKGYVVAFDDVTHLIQAQRAAAWGEIAQRLAHEVKNPLTPIQLSAERIQQKLSDKLRDEDKDMLNRSTQTIVNQVEAMKNMVNAFREYAHTSHAALKNIDLNRIVAEVLALYEVSNAKINLKLDTYLPMIKGDETQLRQVIHNLLQNAQDALSNMENATITVATEHINNQVKLKITDNGNGFSESIMARAFEPYVTTKTKGTGLGLAIVKKIIDDHHGVIHLENIQPHGACVSVSLPVSQTKAVMSAEIA